MALSKKNALIIVTAVFIGIVAGLIISANFDMIFDGFVSNNNAVEAKKIDSIDNDKIDKAYTAEERSNEADALESEDYDSGTSQLLELEKAYIKVAEEVKPWVVTITSAKIIRYRQTNPFDFFGRDLWDFFGYRQNPNDQDQESNNQREFRQEGLGSGVIVSSDGYILTNNHVVKDADEIRVVTMDKKEYSAELIGKDEKTDVAVVRIKADGLPFAKLGDSDQIRVGQIVMAIGNPFSQQLQHTVTEGIISAQGRANIGLSAYEDFIQTTAAINPGNSGGALVDLQGRLIGINTAILSRSGGFNGIGFAIPINMAKRVMELLIDKGYVVRGYLGVVPQAVDEEMAQALGLEKAEGALITSVEEGTPAAKAGLKQEDVVLSINGKKVEDATDFRLKIAAQNPGDKIDLKIYRDGKIKDITITLTERPDDQPTATLSEKETKKLGITVSNLTPERERRYGYEDEEGVVVVEVSRTSAAWRKGIRENDLITSINRQEIKNVRDYDRIVDDVKDGDILLIRLKRRVGNAISTFYVTIRIDR